MPENTITLIQSDVMTEVKSRICTKCGLEKPLALDYWHKCAANPEGFKTQCKECGRAAARQWRVDNIDRVKEKEKRYRENNQEKIKAYGRHYRASHKEHFDATREKRAEYQRLYRAINRERLLANDRLYRQEHRSEILERRRESRRVNRKKIRFAAHQHYLRHRDRLLEKQRQYHRANPQKAHAASLRRRARVAALPYDFKDDDWNYCLEYFGYRCVVCGNQLRDLFGEIEPHAEHWIAISDPRPDNPGTVPGNMVCMCNKCNLAKSNTPPEQWLKSTLGLRRAKSVIHRVEVFFSTVRGSELA